MGAQKHFVSLSSPSPHFQTSHLSGYETSSNGYEMTRNQGPEGIPVHDTNPWFGLSSTKFVKVGQDSVNQCVSCSTEATRKEAFLVLLCPLLRDNYLETFIDDHKETGEHHEAEPHICRNLHNKSPRCLRNSTCSLLSGALGVCLCLLTSVARDSAGSLRGKCHLLIKYLLFSISPISEGHRGT